jgi:hypothetical protein
MNKPCSVRAPVLAPPPPTPTPPLPGDVVDVELVLDVELVFDDFELVAVGVTGLPSLLTKLPIKGSRLVAAFGVGRLAVTCDSSDEASASSVARILTVEVVVVGVLVTILA